MFVFKLSLSIMTLVATIAFTVVVANEVKKYLKD